MWTCPGCTNNLPDTLATCLQCGSARPAVPADPEPQDPGSAQLGDRQGAEVPDEVPAGARVRRSKFLRQLTGVPGGEEGRYPYLRLCGNLSRILAKVLPAAAVVGLVLALQGNASLGPCFLILLGGLVSFLVLQATSEAIELLLDLTVAPKLKR